MLWACASGHDLLLLQNRAKKGWKKATGMTRMFPRPANSFFLATAGWLAHPHASPVLPERSSSGSPGCVTAAPRRPVVAQAPGTLPAKRVGERGSKKGHSKSEQFPLGEAKANQKDENQLMQS